MTTTCASQMAACQASADCMSFVDCMSACAPNDDVCLNGCASSYPNGVQLYSDFAYCIVCTACYGDCDGAASSC